MATVKAAKMPLLIYGTAWKKDQTRILVKRALLAGFRGVDTAAQPKHYQEDLVGQGILDAMQAGGIKRESLYIQTKFTSTLGQDPNRMPYDPSESITDQVKKSVASSLDNLRHTADGGSNPYIDCLVLHSPFRSLEDTKEAWRAMESHVPERARTLGISNVYQVEVLENLYDMATVKPSVVQNRFYAQTGYDKAVRAFCKDKGVVYQSFWTLTGNPNLLKSDAVAKVAEKASVSKPVALYSLVLGLGNMSVLDGTTNSAHMSEDLIGVQRIQSWSEAAPKAWKEIQDSFQVGISI